MKAFIFYTTTDDRWELCGGVNLVTANSKEEAEAMFTNPDETICEIEEIDLSVTGQIEIQQSMIE